MNDFFYNLVITLICIEIYKSKQLCLKHFDSCETCDAILSFHLIDCTLLFLVTFRISRPFSQFHVFKKNGNNAGVASPSQRDPPMAVKLTNEHPNSLFSLFRISATTISSWSRSRFTTTCRYLIVCRIILTTNDITNIVQSVMVWLLTYNHPPKLCRPGLHFLK